MGRTKRQTVKETDQDRGDAYIGAGIVAIVLFPLLCEVIKAWCGV